MEVFGWGFWENFSKRTDWLTTPSSSCLKPRHHAWRLQQPSYAHIDKRHPLRWCSGKMERAPTKWLRHVLAVNRLPWSAFYGRKMNSLFAEATVSKVFCNLQSNAFLTVPVTFCDTLQLICSLFLPQDAPRQCPLANTSQGLTTGLPHSNTPRGLPPLI